SPTAIVGPPLAPPSLQHLFGTDYLGRDVLSRVVWGARPELVAAALSTALAAVVGVPLGMVAGARRRLVGGVVMRSMDVLLAFPGILLALVVVTVAGSGLETIVIAVALSLAPVFARLAYAQTMSLMQRGFVMAARVVGSSEVRTLRRQVLPNLVGDVLVSATSMVGWAILIAASLNFLGFGVQPPGADWGADLSTAVQYLNTAWWTATFPGLAIAVTILAVNAFGDSLAEWLDPRTEQSRGMRLVDIEVERGVALSG
ncbi:MAG TPA: ABC transporter permease, partial [Acidimicrobiales bacterium]|nr:ABC transporter permease [Acidimicrobiales bacterium]